MKIYYDENMPFAADFFQQFGTLIPFVGRELNADQLIDADVLLVRSITKVNEALLSKASKLKFVGTATIGVDHIDQSYLASKNIAFSSAPGCNAISVGEYVTSALTIVCEKYQRELSSLTIGIVGAGNTGTSVAKKLSALGCVCKLYDPLLANSANDDREFSSFEDILSCDVISLHVPLTSTGQYPTFHLFNETVLNQLSTEQILINACRGEVVDNLTLLTLKQQNQGPALIWDVWEKEPNILLPLMEYTDIATAHIAGYSLEGKSRGTEMLYQALCQEFGAEVKTTLANCLPNPKIQQIEINESADASSISKLIQLVYDVRRDDYLFRRQIVAKGFDYIRKSYPTRREFSSLNVITPKTETYSKLKALGFQLSEK